ncbi:MAG TPA: hypothetical protein PL164_00220 [Candidatus Paceibacterota bacterium]|nr:hypothetical protein [Candidatus Paceibacterota bacterium]HOK97205.1 hypothetical protein [Candidatus Paceibacterota bacterium]HPP64604.1 hypothetical protein [Candidatus Paceibacterota bacterium]HRT18473.1 hypothetical protein [Candidatus Paceibacterota bacterium]
MKKNIYRIPVEIKSKENNPLQISISYNLRVVAENRKIAIGIANSQAEKLFYKNFPSYTPKIKIDTENIKVVANTSKEIKTKKRLPREPRLPFEEKFEEKIKLLDTRIRRVGNTEIKHKVIEYGEFLLFLLANEEASFNKREEKLIITGYENRKPVYVKILTQNADGVPVLIRWDVEKGKLVSSIEFIEGYQNYNSYIGENEYRKTSNIARQKLKYLLEKEVKNEKED